MKKVINRIFLFIEKEWKLLLLLFVILFLLQKCRNSNEKVANLQQQVLIDSFERKSLENTVKYWQDKYGEQHAVIEQMEVSNQVQSNYLDSIADLLNIKSKQIQSVARVRTKTHIDAPLTTDPQVRTVPCPEDYIEIVESIPFKYSDTWTSIIGTVYADKTLKRDSIHFASVDTLDVVDYWKRDRVLGVRIGPIRGYVDYSNKNKNNQITGGKKITLKPPKQRWALGLSVQLGYPVVLKPDWQKPQVTVGLSIQKAIIKF